MKRFGFNYLFALELRSGGTSALSFNEIISKIKIYLPQNIGRAVQAGNAASVLGDPPTGFVHFLKPERSLLIIEAESLNHPLLPAVLCAGNRIRFASALRVLLLS